MASNAFTTHLLELLKDAEDLDVAHGVLRTGNPGRQWQSGLAAINRASVIMCVSAWEAYIEEVVKEAVEAIKPHGTATGVWPSLNASVRSQIGRFNTPNADQVRLLLSDSIGLLDIRRSWSWKGNSWERAVQRLAEAMNLRHEIAHGVNPRPNIHNYYSSQLPDFFRRLGRCSDNAIRAHVVDVLGIQNPWPV